MHSLFNKSMFKNNLSAIFTQWAEAVDVQGLRQQCTHYSITRWERQNEYT